MRAAEPGQRAAWLKHRVATMPADPAALLTDFIPSILGTPDAATLDIIVGLLYHRDERVRRFAAGGLGYWPRAAIIPAISKPIKERGPTEAAVRVITSSHP